MLWIVLGLGWIVSMVTFALVVPPSRELVIKLGTLIDMARRANPDLFLTRLEPINPFIGKQFKHARIAPVLRANLSEFGVIPERLQREAKRLDRKAHVGMLPMALYALAVSVWYVLK